MSECKYILTGLHSLNLDIASFGRVVHINRRHVATCLDTLAVACPDLEGSYLLC